jgi:hypothetical protein
MDQLVLDELPDDAGHLIAVELDDRIGDLDLCHVANLCLGGGWRRVCAPIASSSPQAKVYTRDLAGVSR